MSRWLQKIDIDKIALNVIMLTNCFLCFFEEVIEMHILVMLLYAAAVGLLILKKKMTFVRGTGLMLLYVLGILLSIVISGTTFRGIYRAGLVTMMVGFASFAYFETDTFELTKRAFVLLGLFNAVMVLVQFVFKDSFTYLLHTFLNEKAVTEAMHYYGRGYYAGINVKPHETAGMIMVAIAALFTMNLEGKKRWWLAVPVALFFPLLLTGKRAIFVLTAGCAVLLYVFTQLAKRRWRRVLTMVVGAVAAGVAAILVIKFNLDHPLFARFALLFDGGSVIDQTRLNLWADAWQLFTEHPLFGVGWPNFNDLTVEYFGYHRNHAVNLDYLQFLCETGIVGFVMMMTPIVFTLVRAVKIGWHAAKGELPATQRGLVFFAVYLQFFILLYALIEVPFYTTMFFAYYMFSTMIVHVYYTRYLADEHKQVLSFDWTQVLKNGLRIGKKSAQS